MLRFNSSPILPLRLFGTYLLVFSEPKEKRNLTSAGVMSWEFIIVDKHVTRPSLLTEEIRLGVRTLKLEMADGVISRGWNKKVVSTVVFDLITVRRAPPSADWDQITFIPAQPTVRSELLFFSALFFPAELWVIHDQNPAGEWTSHLPDFLPMVLNRIFFSVSFPAVSNVIAVRSA